MCRCAQGQERVLDLGAFVSCRAIFLVHKQPFNIVKFYFVRVMELGPVRNEPLLCGCGPRLHLWKEIWGSAEVRIGGPKPGKEAGLSYMTSRRMQMPT